MARGSIAEREVIIPKTTLENPGKCVLYVRSVIAKAHGILLKSGKPKSSGIGTVDTLKLLLYNVLYRLKEEIPTRSLTNLFRNSIEKRKSRKPTLTSLPPTLQMTLEHLMET